MAKFRYINTRFWDDSYVAELAPETKLVFLYLLTNSLTTIAGVYELPIKKAAFDLGLSIKQTSGQLKKLEADGKVYRFESWVGIKNFIKHQSLNPKVRRGIETELSKAPPELVARLELPVEVIPIDHDRLSHSNSNPKYNSKRRGVDKLSPDVETFIRRVAERKSFRK